ncbi:MAG: DUF3592 domain-containing protein [Candidatus Hodarchaeales archaeon]
MKITTLPPMRTLYILLISTALLPICVILGIIPDNFVSMLLGWGSLKFFVYSTPFYPEAIASRSWRTTDGEIITSEIRKKGTSTSGVSSYPVIEYTYNVDEQEYKSDRLKVGIQTISSTGSTWPEDMINKYHLQKIVKVYYSARKPENAVLEPGINLRIYGFTIGGIGFFLASLIVDSIAREIANMPDITENILQVIL